MLRKEEKKIPAISPPNFYFILFLFYQTKCYMEMTSYNMQGMIKPV
jgi:hypothetical protein